MMPLDRVRHVRRSSNVKLEAAKQCVKARALQNGVMYSVLRVRVCKYIEAQVPAVRTLLVLLVLCCILRA